MHDRGIITLLIMALQSRSLLFHQSFVAIPAERRQSALQRLTDQIESSPLPPNSISDAALAILGAAQYDPFDYWSILAVSDNGRVARYIDAQYRALGEPGVKAPLETLRREFALAA